MDRFSRKTIGFGCTDAPSILRIKSGLAFDTKAALLLIPSRAPSASLVIPESAPSHYAQRKREHVPLKGTTRVQPRIRQNLPLPATLGYRVPRLCSPPNSPTPPPSLTMTSYLDTNRIYPFRPPFLARQHRPNATLGTLGSENNSKRNGRAYKATNLPS